MEQVEKHHATFDSLLEEVVVVSDVLETTEVQVAEVITSLKSIEKTVKAGAFGVPKKVVSKVVAYLDYEVVDEENQATLDYMETDMTSRNLSSILKDHFDYSTLNHK